MPPMQFTGGLAADAVAIAFLAALVGSGVGAWRVRDTNRTLMWALIALVVTVLAVSLLWTYMLGGQ
jgi:uncharacterized membrane protein YhaH (DUF805 family)